MMRLRLGMLRPLSIRSSWNRRTSSGVAVAGERFKYAANRSQLSSGVFFTLAMHRRLLTNFFLGRFHLGLGPSLHRLSPQQPHFLDNPLFDRVGLLEIFARIRYRHGY